MSVIYTSFSSNTPLKCKRFCFGTLPAEFNMMVLHMLTNNQPIANDIAHIFFKSFCMLTNNNQLWANDIAHFFSRVYCHNSKYSDSEVEVHIDNK